MRLNYLAFLFREDKFKNTKRCMGEGDSIHQAKRSKKTVLSRYSISRINILCLYSHIDFILYLDNFRFNLLKNVES